MGEHALARRIGMTTKKWTAAMTLALVAVAGTLGAAPAERRVEIKQFTYAPGAVEIRTGSTVTWVNGDEELHTVTSSGGLFASPGLEHDETFSQRFNAPGTYRYFCSLHPNMTGAIVVK
jgi:plastocyanin